MRLEAATPEAPITSKAESDACSLADVDAEATGWNRAAWRGLALYRTLLHIPVVSAQSEPASKREAAREKNEEGEGVCVWGAHGLS